MSDVCIFKGRFGAIRSTEYEPYLDGDTVAVLRKYSDENHGLILREELDMRTKRGREVAAALDRVGAAVEVIQRIQYGAAPPILPVQRSKVA